MPAAGIRAAVLRRGVLGLAAVLVAVVAIAVATTEPAGGEAPLECDGGLYVTTGSPDDMTLTRVDQETGALTAVGDGGLVANALGHNPRDDFLYGIDRNAPHHVVRVSAGGDEVDLGPAVGRAGLVGADLRRHLPGERPLPRARRQRARPDLAGHRARHVGRDRRHRRPP